MTNKGYRKNFCGFKFEVQQLKLLLSSPDGKSNKEKIPHNGSVVILGLWLKVYREKNKMFDRFMLDEYFKKLGELLQLTDNLKFLLA